MAHGKTLELRAIRTPEPVWIHQFRTRSIKRGKRQLVVRDGLWTPYVNPARDLKRHARLRVELRGATS
jgi:hypothetical protein